MCHLLKIVFVGVTGGLILAAVLYATLSWLDRRHDAAR